MEKQFNYLIKLAKEYQTYEEDDQALFEALQSLDQDKLRGVYNKYGNTGGGYQPVNMLRAEVAGRLLNGDNITPEMILNIYQMSNWIKWMLHLRLQMLLQFGKGIGPFFTHSSTVTLKKRQYNSI
jgi:5-methylcytosine-specific restriction protein B